MNEIKLFLMDCDGVLTDGGMYYFEDGNECKKFNTRDGMGLKIIRELGIKTGIITGEKTKIVSNRAKKLKIDYVFMGVENKLEIINKLCSELNLEYSQILYVGDDINDLEVLKKVKYSCCPFDAQKQVKQICQYISKSNGGQGVIRDIVDKYFGEE